MYATYEAFDDPDRHAHSLSGWDQRYDQVGGGAFRSWIKHVETKSVHVFHECANVRLVQQAQLPAKCTTFGLALGRGAPFFFQGIKVDESALICAPGDKEFVLHSPPDMSMLGIAVETTVLQAVADAEGFDLHRGVSADHVLKIPPAAGGNAALRIVSAVEAALAQPVSFENQATRGCFARDVIESIADLLALHAPTREDRLTYACRV